MASNPRFSTALRMIAGGLAVVIVLSACGSDANPSEGAADDDGLPAPPATYDLPDDFPLPAPQGGNLESAVFDDAAGTGRVVISYSQDAVVGLTISYDAFFGGLDGESVVVPLTDGLASWQNDGEGYSVVLDAQNENVQVTLQTGV